MHVSGGDVILRALMWADLVQVNEVLLLKWAVVCVKLEEQKRQDETDDMGEKGAEEVLDFFKL